MTRVVFLRDASRRLVGFDIIGHAGYADFGRDIVCAAVSSCSELILHQLCDCFGFDTDCTVDPDSASVHCMLCFAADAPNESRDTAHFLLDGFYRTMSETSDEYPRFLKCTITEV